MTKQPALCLAALLFGLAAAGVADDGGKRSAASSQKSECCTIELPSPFAAGPASRTPAPGTAGALVEGNPAGQVRVLVYEDLQCPDCAAFRKVMDAELLPAFGQKVAFEHRDFPLPKHSWARKAAIAARYFHETHGPQRATEFRRYMLENIGKTTPENFTERLTAFARSTGADPSKAVASLADERYASLVERDFSEGLTRGVQRTPTVFVAGMPFVERFSVEEISKAIKSALHAQGR